MSFFVKQEVCVKMQSRFCLKAFMQFPLFGIKQRLVERVMFNGIKNV